MALKQLTSIDLYIYDPYIFADSVEVLSRGPNEEQDYEPETGRDGAETEIDSAPSSLLQIPSNERDEIKEATEEGDDTLIPDSNDLNDQTESAGEITYTMLR